MSLPILSPLWYRPAGRWFEMRCTSVHDTCPPDVELSHFIRLRTRVLKEPIV